MIEIGTPELRAVINPLGAELTSLRDRDGNELLTNGDPAFWASHAPLLFPIVGELRGGVCISTGSAMQWGDTASRVGKCSRSRSRKPIMCAFA